MKIIFSQGNPDTAYTNTRHNIGFDILNYFAEKNQADWHKDKKFNAQIAEITTPTNSVNTSEKILLVKPLSYYNETGRVARAMLDFYKLNPQNDFLLIHDELALPFNTVRVRGSGSDAGNNGIKSLNSHIGQSYTRIRIGIWNNKRDLVDDASFVLAKFNKEEEKALPSIIEDKVLPLIDQFIQCGKLENTSK